MKKKVIYKIAIVLLIFVFAIGGIFNILRFPEAMESLKKLGYPIYFSTILGFAQLLGGIVLFIPGREKLKEIVFFGFFINLISAFISHYIVEGIVPVHGIILFVIGIVIVAFSLSRNLHSSQ